MSIKYETTVVNQDWSPFNWHVVNWDGGQLGECYCTDEDLQELLPRLNPNHKVTVYNLFYPIEFKWD